MKYSLFFVLTFFLLACNEPDAPLPKEDMQEEDKKNSNKKDSIDVVSELDTLFEVTEGVYYKSNEHGFIKLSLYQVDSNQSKFVFDAYGSGYAKLAGELTFDENGKAGFTKERCEHLSFHCTDQGVSIKEFNCEFHSKQFPFDGLYQKLSAENTLSNDARKKMLKDLQSEQSSFDFYAVFTEPFYTLYFIEDELIIEGIDEHIKIHQLITRFDPNLKKQQIYYRDEQGSYKKFTIVKELGNDGMSEIMYPYTVKWGELFGGGGKEFQKEEYLEENI